MVVKQSKSLGKEHSTEQTSNFVYSVTPIDTEYINYIYIEYICSAYTAAGHFCEKQTVCKHVKVSLP